MAKYIIDVKDGETLYKAVIAPDGEPYITPAVGNVYTEPDLEQVRCAAYEEGHNSLLIEVQKAGKNTIKLEEDEYYQRGLNDAWEAARTLWYTPNRKEIFGHTTFNTVLTTLTAQETIEKIQQYEQNEQESITAEDVMLQYLDTFCKGRICKGCPLNTPDFNFICGRGYHFITSNPISDEEVRRAYAEVCKR